MGSGKRSGKREPENLYQREGIFYARVTVGGREHRRSLKTSNRREAERRLTQWLKERSPYKGTIRHTFKEAAALWLEAGDWKPKTARSYVQRLNILLAHFGDHYWDQVDKAALQFFIDQRRKAGSGTATINRYLTVVSGIANYVGDLDGWPEINPVTLLAKKPRREKRAIYVRPPASDIEAYFARMQGTFGDLCRVALLCGARMDELAYLHRENAKDGQATFLDTKSGIPRTVAWTPEARAIVDRQPVVEGSPYLFNTSNKGPYKRVTEMWREVVIRAQRMAQKSGRKLQRMRFHDLRHEYAIRYLESGKSIYTLQKLLGHGSIRQTERYLDYLTTEQQEKVTGSTAQ
jgi:integrase